MANYQYEGPSWLLNRREQDALIEWVPSHTALAAFDDTDTDLVFVADGSMLWLYQDTSATNPAATTVGTDIIVGMSGRTWRLMELAIPTTQVLDDWIGLAEIT